MGNYDGALGKFVDKYVHIVCVNDVCDLYV